MRLATIYLLAPFIYLVVRVALLAWLIFIYLVVRVAWLRVCENQLSTINCVYRYFSGVGYVQPRKLSMLFLFSINS